MRATAVDDVVGNGTSDDDGRRSDFVMSSIEDKVTVKHFVAPFNVAGPTAKDPHQLLLGTSLENEFEDIGALDIPVVPVKKLILRSYLQPIQEWEGYVTDVFDDRFIARLVDVTSGEDAAKEEAEFPIQDVADTDRSLLRPGAVFRWTIGYLKSQAGNKKRVSQIVFRRLPQWTNREMLEAASTAKEIASNIAWE